MSTSSDYPAEVFDLLNSQRVGYLCTSDKRSKPHVTPIFFTYDFEKHRLFFVSSKNSKKLANMAKMRNVALAVDVRDLRNPLVNRGMLVRGRVSNIKDYPSAAKNGYEGVVLLAHKYEEAFTSPDSAIREFRGVLVSVDVEKVTYWKGPFFKVLKVQHMTKTT